MSIRDLLLLLETDPARATCVGDYAVSLAQQMKAHLTVAGVALEFVPPASFMGDYPYDIMAQATAETRAKIEKAYTVLANGATADVQTELVTIQALPGTAREEFGKLARHFDLTIVAQAQPVVVDDELMAEAALFQSGRPTLIVPYTHKGPAKLGKVVVAWDGGRSAARAIGDAMPFLQRAGKVDVVSIAANDLSPDELPGFNITRHLARHGVNAESRRLPSGADVGSILLSYLADSSADLLVMGGYGHARWREFVLGGTTRTLLQSMTAPVLLSH